MTKTLAVLGSTGSIGVQALEVARLQGFEIVALTSNVRTDILEGQIREFSPRMAAVADEKAAAELKIKVADTSTRILAGREGVAECAACGADTVLNSIVGIAGLEPTLRAIEAGSTLALANKESLVVGGDLIMPLATHETLLPVDSEHSAIYQCYLGEFPDEARRIWLTCSGGPFRGMTREQLAEVTAAQALAHPTWNMGPKITIDSATLMNKGLEVIEAQHLFDVKTDDIRVVVHPQSCVHSMAEYVDGSVKAHLGVADMRIPIQFALSYPHRWESPATQVDFTQMGPLEFLDPDLETFRCLALALEAGRTGGTLPCVMNAANEVAVAAFLADACRLTDIDATVERVMEQMGSEPVESLEQLEDIDARSRALASDILTRG